MTKILKKVQLSAEQSTPMSADPTKGTPIKPFTQEEMTQLQKEGMWEGGSWNSRHVVPRRRVGERLRQQGQDQPAPRKVLQVHACPDRFRKGAGMEGQ